MATVTAAKVIKVEKKYNGYLEKETNKNLDSMKANAGDENYTRFARDYYKYTGINCQGQPWCAMYQSVCLVEAFGLEIAKKLLGGKLYHNCATAVEQFKKAGIWKTSDPKVGDVVIFQNKSNRPCHTGMVIKVSGKVITTIEGNTSSAPGVVANGGCVRIKTYSVNYGGIAGYGEMKYSKYNTAKKKTNSKVYVVKEGDTLSSIAEKNKTTVAKLVKLNNISNPNKIKVGQKIKLS